MSERNKPIGSGTEILSVPPDRIPVPILPLNKNPEVAREKVLRPIPQVLREEIAKLPADWGDDPAQLLEEHFPHLNRFIKEQATWGLDCHSYLFRCMGFWGLRHPLFQDTAVKTFTEFPSNIQPEDFPLYSDFLDVVDQEYQHRLTGPGAESFLQFLRSFTQTFFDQAIQEENDVPSSVRPEEFSARDMDESERQYTDIKQADRAVQQALDRILDSEKRFPRVVEVFLSYPDGPIRAVHSSFILGPITNAQGDYWVLERSRSGLPVRLTRLSETIHTYNNFHTSPRHVVTGTTVHFCLSKNEQTVLNEVSELERKHAE